MSPSAQVVVDEANGVYAEVGATPSSRVSLLARLLSTVIPVFPARCHYTYRIFLYLIFLSQVREGSYFGENCVLGISNTRPVTVPSLPRPLLQ